MLIVHPARFGIFRWESDFGVLNEDGKIWTQELAKSAVEAVGVLDCLRQVVAFVVGSGGGAENATRAEFNAKPATFTAFLDDADGAARNLDAVVIQGLSPKLHRLETSVCSRYAGSVSLLHHSALGSQRFYKRSGRWRRLANTVKAAEPNRWGSGRED
jgi:hypothetical protein